MFEEDLIFVCMLIWVSTTSSMDLHIDTLIIIITTSRQMSHKILPNELSIQKVIPISRVEDDSKSYTNNRSKYGLINGDFDLKGLISIKLIIIKQHFWNTSTKIGYTYNSSRQINWYKRCCIKCQ